MRPASVPTTLLALLLSSIPVALGDVKIVSPAPGQSVPGGTTFTVSWTDSGTAPAIVDLLSYDIFLFSGSNAQPQQLYALVPGGSFATGNSATATVPITIGGPGTNVYFIGVRSVAKAGGTVTNYSDRFTLTGMTGTFSAAVLAANKNIAGTAGPPTVNQIAAANPAPGGPIDQGAWGTPYNLQEGPTRYAPMQPVPPTKITQTRTAPLWPTSSVPIATTFLPPVQAQIVTTQTQPQTYSQQSHANTAAPQSHPTDDMQKFLNRWKD